MMFGSILYYLGLTLAIGTLSGMIIAIIIFQIMYGLYIKLIEEKELEIRFGKECIKYKR